MATEDARRAAAIVDETRQELDIRMWHEEGLRLLAKAETAATEARRREDTDADDVLEASARAAMEEVAEAMSIDKSTRVDTVPRAVASEVVLEEQPEPAPVLSKRLIVICVVALFLIVIFGGWVFSALELEHELDMARAARVKPYEAFLRILPGLDAKDREWLLTELYQDSTLVNYRCGMCDELRGIWKRTFPLLDQKETLDDLKKICRGSKELKFCNWKLSGGTYFTLTCFTTIGYGNFTPQTTGGRIWVVVVTTLGMVAAFPLFAQIGEHLLRGLRRLPITEGQRGLIVGTGLVAYLLLGATCFYYLNLLEDEPDYALTLYWSFVTLSTLGLGDVVPKTHRQVAIVCTFFFVIGGISLMSLVIQFFQEQTLPRVVTGYDTAPVHSAGHIDHLVLSAAPDVRDSIDRHSLSDTVAPGL
mmetsp:Transcript_28422/g.87935  ORF Transcript_28422/g.87935 Transcript_28422/m.87935 type:complete len:419 (+) Transcript_28422:264-1520(+)